MWWRAHIHVVQGNTGSPRKVERPDITDRTSHAAKRIMDKNHQAEDFRFLYPAWDHPLPQHAIFNWHREVANHPGVQRDQIAQVGTLMLCRGNNMKP